MTRARRAAQPAAPAAKPAAPKSLINKQCSSFSRFNRLMTDSNTTLSTCPYQRRYRGGGLPPAEPAEPAGAVVSQWLKTSRLFACALLPAADIAITPRHHAGYQQGNNVALVGGSDALMVLSAQSQSCALLDLRRKSHLSDDWRDVRRAPSSACNRCATRLKQLDHLRDRAAGVGRIAVTVR